MDVCFQIGVFPSNFVVELFDEPSEPKDGTHRKSSRSSLDDNSKAGKEQRI